MKSVEIVQMATQLATLVVTCFIAGSVQKLRNAIGTGGGRDPVGGPILNSSGFASLPQTGFGVWAWRGDKWDLEHDRSEAGCVPGSPPKSKGSFAGERVRTASIPRS